MKKISLLNRVVLIILIIIIVFLLIINKINKVTSPILMIQAKEKAYNIITKTINGSVNKVVSKNLNSNDLFIMTYDSDGTITSIDFDSLVINKVLTSISLEIENSIADIDSETCAIPFGVVFNNSFLSNLGPKVPIKMQLVGSVINNIKTKITNYGINNALIEIYVNIEVNVQVVLPFVSDKVSVETLIPIALKLIRGNVPDYYSGNGSGDSLLSIPIE